MISDFHLCDIFSWNNYCVDQVKPVYSNRIQISTHAFCTSIFYVISEIGIVQCLGSLSQNVIPVSYLECVCMQIMENSFESNVQF
jgi:hypothetical protein